MSFPEEKEATIQVLKDIARPSIVELGSQNGEDMEWILESCAGRQPRAVMVEADHANFMKLVTRRMPGKHLYIHAAIAGYDGECEFWENHDLGWGYGSIYAPLPGNSVNYDLFKKVGPIPCFTFDSLWRENEIGGIDLLRADIHGAEKDMIQFGQEALKNTRYLFIEAVETPLYEGMATRTELLAMLPNWTVVQQFPWNLLLRNNDCD